MSDTEPIFSSSLKRLELPGIGSPDSAAFAIPANGDLVVSVKLGRFLLMAEIADETNLVGETEDGSTIQLEGAFVRHASATTGSVTEPAATSLELSARRLELFTAISGTTPWTRKEVWLHGPRVFGTICWTFEDYDFEMAPHAVEPLPGVRSTSLKVTRRTVTGNDDFPRILEATLCLLSVADRVRCRAFLIKTYSHNDLLHAEAVPYPNQPHGTHPLIPPVDVSQFIVTTLPSYLQKESAWSLKTLIGYYCRSHEETLAEAKFIFASVFMEALKFTWALNVGKLPQDRKQSGLIRGFKRPTNGNYSFDELMQLVVSALKLNHTYTFIDDRNALFHSGQAATLQTGATVGTWQALRSELVPLHNQIDEILLSILGYSGKIREFWDQSNQRLFTAPK